MPMNVRSGGSEKALGVGGDAAPASSGEQARLAVDNRVLSRTLSSTDAAFIYLERENLPLAIASVCIFDEVVPFDPFVASVESKLDLIPRYRQIVVTPPLDLGLPIWQDDPHFDIRRHIFRINLDSPGGEAELEALAGRILSERLDRKKPLWDIHVVDGLKNGRGALIFRLHHALADGVSAARLQEVLLDTSPQGSPALPKPPYRRPRQRPSDLSLTAAISSGMYNALGGLIAAEAGLISLAEAFFSERMQEGLKGLLGLLPELAASVERLPFNKPCGRGRKFCWAEFDFYDVEAIRKAVGGTINDVVLAVLTRALARYVKLHGQTVVNRFVRIVCPVSLRKADSREGLGNLLSFLPVALPMDVRDPVRMLRAVATRTATMKNAGAAHLVSLAAACIAAAPAPLQSLFWWGIPQVILPVPLLNMICTNVPGPRVPLYAVGKRMIASYPQVPTGYDLGVNCAVESYNGKLFFGFIADAQVASDVDRLRDFLRVSFRELCHAARKKAHTAAKRYPRGRGEGAGQEPQARSEPPKTAEAATGLIPEPVQGGAPTEAPASAVAEVKKAA